jgi:Glycosyltransferase (GlcNAc)
MHDRQYARFGSVAVFDMTIASSAGISCRTDQLKDGSMASDAARATIFISLASYCDPLLWWTVRSAWDKAAHPERLSFGVLDQSPSSAPSEFLNGPWFQQLRYAHVLPKYSRGACWARSLVFQMVQEEDYLLQIDSHTLFEKDWDSKLTRTLENVSGESSTGKIVLSTRPFGFEIDSGLNPVTRQYTSDALVLKPREGADFDNDHPILPFEAFVSGQQRPIKGFQVAAGFIFTRGAFVRDVPYDPQLYFHGEEQNLAIRAFTRGWDIWHPNVPPLFHQYKNHKAQQHAMHWDPIFDRERLTPWIELEKASRQRMRELLFDRTLIGTFGLGDVRSLKDFRDLSGIDYELRKICSLADVANDASGPA